MYNVRIKGLGQKTLNFKMDVNELVSCYVAYAKEPTISKIETIFRNGNIYFSFLKSGIPYFITAKWC